jgi:hypothetical protein
MGRDNRPRRTFLGLYGPPAGKTWAELTDDEIGAWAAEMADAMKERLAGRSGDT